MQIYAFLGPARVGKTSASNHLHEVCEKRGYYVQRLSFAGPIKAGCARLGVTKEEQPDEYRSLAQRWGAGRRLRNPLHYIRKMGRAIERIRRVEQEDYAKLDAQGKLDCWDETVIIIDDVRYENEVKALTDIGAEVCFLNPGERLNLTEEFRQHESEALSNKLVNDDEFLEEFMSEYECWELPADQSEEMMMQLIDVYCDHLWFNSTFPHLH